MPKILPTLFLLTLLGASCRDAGRRDVGRREKPGPLVGRWSGAQGTLRIEAAPDSGTLRAVHASGLTVTLRAVAPGRYSSRGLSPEALYLDYERVGETDSLRETAVDGAYGTALVSYYRKRKSGNE